MGEGAEGSRWGLGSRADRPAARREPVPGIVPVAVSSTSGPAILLPSRLSNLRTDTIAGGRGGRRRVVVELKTVSALESAHFAQMMTYLKLSGREVGLLINVNDQPPSASSPSRASSAIDSVEEGGRSREPGSRSEGR